MMWGVRQGKPKGSRWGLLGRAAGLFRPYRTVFILMVALIAASTAMQLGSVRIMGAMVDEMNAGTRDDLDMLALIVAGLVLGSALIGVGQSYLNQVIGQGVMLTLRSDLHAHLQRLPVRFFTQTRTGEILSRVSTDVNAIQNAVTGTFTDLLQALLTFIIAFALMFMLQWQLALATLLILPLWVYPTIRVGERMRALMREWHEESATMSSQLEETLSVSGSMLVKTFGREEHEAARFEESNQSMRSLAIRRMMAGRWFNMATSGFGALIPGIVYWYGGRSVLGGDAVSVGDVVAFAMLAQQVFGPFATIARINTTMLSSAALFERIFEYLDLPVEVEERPGAVELTGARGHVSFERVEFSYVDERPALEDVTFEALPGQMVALVGPSGAGKTTVTYMLQRFYDPQRGAIRLDGHDLRDLTLASVSANVGAVMQETYLFHASLADNIRYGRLDAADAEVQEAARMAGLGPLIDRLPQGLETVVGERGFRLSGGEKQRVAIARAVLKDPPVLILDEATSSLDSRLEREIREAMAILARGRTTVVIAHRLSTVAAADLILVLDGGRVVERGTHEHLLAQGGLYTSLYREQFASPEDSLDNLDGAVGLER